MHTTHISTAMPWAPALVAWLAAARAPQAGAPVLERGVLDGAVSPEDLMARADACAGAYIEAERATAAVTGAHIWGASVPRRVDSDLVWGSGQSRCILRPIVGGWVVEVDLIADVDPYECAVLLRADAARRAGVTWGWVRPDVRPAVRAQRETSAPVH